MSAEGELRGSQARSLSIRSCLHRLSMDVENLPFLGLLFICVQEMGGSSRSLFQGYSVLAPFTNTAQMSQTGTYPFTCRIIDFIQNIRPN